MKRKLAMAAALAAGLFGTAAEARSAVNQWFCKVLKAPFDPAAAIAAFPLEKLPPPEETRRPVGKPEESRSTSVSLESEGENYSVDYRYQYKNDDVTDPYSFTLQVSARYPLSEEIAPQMDKWLREFGRPERTIMGEAVFAGPAMYPGGPRIFSFERWQSSATYSADWQNRAALRHAADLCK